MEVLVVVVKQLDHGGNVLAKLHEITIARIYRGRQEQLHDLGSNPLGIQRNGFMDCGALLRLLFLRDSGGVVVADSIGRRSNISRLTTLNNIDHVATGDRGSPVTRHSFRKAGKDTGVIASVLVSKIIQTALTQILRVGAPSVQPWDRRNKRPLSQGHQAVTTVGEVRGKPRVWC